MFLPNRLYEEVLLEMRAKLHSDNASFFTRQHIHDWLTGPRKSFKSYMQSKSGAWTSFLMAISGGLDAEKESKWFKEAESWRLATAPELIRAQKLESEGRAVTLEMVKNDLLANPESPSSSVPLSVAASEPQVRLVPAKIPIKASHKRIIDVLASIGHATIITLCKLKPDLMRSIFEFLLKAIQEYASITDDQDGSVVLYPDDFDKLDWFIMPLLGGLMGGGKGGGPLKGITKGLKGLFGSKKKKKKAKKRRRQMEEAQRQAEQEALSSQVQQAPVNQPVTMPEPSAPYLPMPEMTQYPQEMDPYAPVGADPNYIEGGMLLQEGEEAGAAPVFFDDGFVS